MASTPRGPPSDIFRLDRRQSNSNAVVVVLVKTATWRAENRGRWELFEKRR